MLSFDFNGENSYTDYGILISSRPDLPSAKRRVEFIEIPGRDSSLRFDEGTYEDITIAVECSIKDSNVSAKLDEIKNWLFSSGEADLVFSFQNDKKYLAQVVNAIDFSQVYKLASKFVILFNCRPFKYAVSSSVLTINTGGGITIANDGTLPSKPIIKVYCTGSGAFTINGRVVTLTDIAVPSFIIDSQIEDAYYDNAGTLENMNNFITGELPILDIGNNNITFSGGVTKLEISPNWRWL
jgi:predicted phage tail component-like protein